MATVQRQVLNPDGISSSKGTRTRERSLRMTLAQPRPRPAAAAWSTALELVLELVEKVPVGGLRDYLAGDRLNHTRFAQPQRIEPNRIFGIVVSPSCVTNLAHRLKRVVVWVALRGY